MALDAICKCGLPLTRLSVRARVTPGRRDYETRHVKLPAVPVHILFALWQAEVSKGQQRSIGRFLEAHLHRRRPGSNDRTALPSKREHQTLEGVQFKEFTHYHDPVVEVAIVFSSGARFEPGRDTLLLDHLRRVGEERVHGLGAGGYLYLNFHHVC